MALDGYLDDEFERIVTALTTIKNNFSDMRDDIRALKIRGSTCDEGIITSGAYNEISLALLVLALKDSGEYENILEEINNPTQI